MCRLHSPCNINLETYALPPSASEFLASLSLINKDIRPVTALVGRPSDWHSDNSGKKKELRGLAIVRVTLAMWEGNWGGTNAVSLCQGFAEEGWSMGYCSGSVTALWGRGKRRDLHKLQTRFLQGETTEDHCTDRDNLGFSSRMSCPRRDRSIG